MFDESSITSKKLSIYRYLYINIDIFCSCRENNCLKIDIVNCVDLFLNLFSEDVEKLY